MLPIGNVTISPTILYQEQGDFSQTVAECYLIAGHITAGIGCRFSDAMIFMLGYQVKLMRVGFSYDYTISTLTDALTGGSEEFSLALLLPYKSPNFKKLNGINCPAF